MVIWSNIGAIGALQIQFSFPSSIPKCAGSAQNVTKMCWQAHCYIVNNFDLGLLLALFSRGTAVTCHLFLVLVFSTSDALIHGY